ncbi:hypothetical protein BV20DRAFT_277031 [Pilatotrama ljubarskyi]|nr:hypothetical protein BV20DRAFT_277031 [Pilatotrama ljubarskyi]
MREICAAGGRRQAGACRSECKEEDTISVASAQKQRGSPRRAPCAPCMPIELPFDLRWELPGAVQCTVCFGYSHGSAKVRRANFS